MAGLRVLYVAGPGNVLGTHACWARGEDDPAVPDVAYSWQFFEACRELDAAGWIIAGRGDRARVDAGSIRVEHRRIPLDGGGGLRFHLGRLLFTLGILVSAIRFRANVLVVSAHGIHWFVLRLAPWFGIRVVPTLHNTLWATGGRPSRLGRWLLARAEPLFRRRCHAILSHPGTCERQVAELTGGKHARLEPFLPFYRPRAFADVPAPPDQRQPFRVLFVGRMEADKGIFDLLDVARRLAARGRLDIEFDLCGAGSCLDALREAALAAGLAARFRCHGRVVGTELRTMFARCHVVVVPTRPEFHEGFNAVVSEAVLAGRPVVTSAVCPALELVRAAAIEVPPADVAAYERAILELCDDVDAYASRQQACRGLRSVFCDPQRSWGSALKRAIAPAPAAAATP